MLNIVHCVTDQKFTKTVIEEFDYIRDRCQNYYVIVSNEPCSFEYISLSDAKRIKCLRHSHFFKFLDNVNCDIVILHNFLSLPPSLICGINSKIKLVWFAWGFDLYESLADKPFIKLVNPFGPKTLELLKLSLLEGLKKKRRSMCKWLNRNLYKKAVNRVDFFSGILPLEYDLMSKQPFFRAKRIHFTYVSPYLNITSELNTKPLLQGRNILIGNSGDPHNNHADIFQLLRRIDISDRKIYVPLSYGGTPRYRDKIIKLGEEIWGGSFIPILNFMPFDEYKKIIESCSFRIFGQERQQAMGNISIAIWEGANVFLSDTSMAYSYLKDIGVDVYTIQNDLTEKRLKSSSDIQFLNENRKKYIQHTLSSSLRGNLDKMLDVLEFN